MSHYLRLQMRKQYILCANENKYFEFTKISSISTRFKCPVFLSETYVPNSSQ